MSDLPPSCSLGLSGLPASFLANLTALKGKLIFVTGGVGFLGGHIVSVLLQAGAKVRVFDVMLPKENHTAWKKEDPVEVIKGQSDRHTEAWHTHAQRHRSDHQSRSGQTHQTSNTGACSHP